MDKQLLCDSERDIFAVIYGLRLVCFIASPYLNKPRHKSLLTFAEKSPNVLKNQYLLISNA
jgi:hypothetical protein